MENSNRLFLKFTVAVVFVLALQLGGFLYLDRRLPGITIYDVTTLSSTELCPGEILEFTFSRIVPRPLTLSWALTVWDIDSKLPVEGATGTSVLYVEDSLEGQHIKWLVPDLAPGNYQRRTRFWIPGEDSRPESFFISFSIREDCGG